MGIYQWSTTAGDNDDAATDINWAEGQAPSTVNDSARELMADVAEWALDLSCSTTTAGSASALTLTTNGSIDSNRDGLLLGFIAGSAANAGATLNVDGQGAKELRRPDDTALQTGDVVSGGAYLVAYDASADSGSGAWLVLNPTITTPEQLDPGTTTASVGSASAPTYTFQGDTDTGVYRPAANEWAVSVGGSEAVRVDSSGSVGIGTTSPSTRLHVDADSNSATDYPLTITNSSLSTGIQVGAYGLSTKSFADSNVTYTMEFTGHLAIIPDLNVGIGTTSPAAKCNIVASGVPFEVQQSSGTPEEIIANFVASDGRYLRILQPDPATDSDPFTFLTNNAYLFRVDTTDAMIINAVGNVGVGTTSPGATLDVNGSLSKGSGSFKIDHPLPALSDTHYLVHSFVEAPTADLVYSGMVQLVDGVATVDIDAAAGMTSGTFEALTTHARRHTSNEDGFAAVRSALSGSTLTIECEDATSTDTVFWMVLAERADPHMLETEWTDENGRVIVEPQKGAA